MPAPESAWPEWFGPVSTGILSSLMINPIRFAGFSSSFRYLAGDSFH